MEKVGNEGEGFTKPKIVKNLRTILQYTRFCTLCFDIQRELSHLDNSLVIEDLEGETLSLRELLEAIFGNILDLLVSDYICEKCKSSACSAFAFINKTKKTSLVYTKYLEQLDKEIFELASRPINKEWNNAMIVLDDYEKNVEMLKGMKESLYICDVCGKGYNRRSFLIKHVTKHITDSGKLICPHCDSRPCMHETYIQGFNEQRLLKQKPMTCVECDFEFSQNLPLLITHVNKKHLGIKKNCPECGKIFYLESHYRKHYKYCHDNKQICTICCCKFKSMKHLKIHMETCKIAMLKSSKRHSGTKLNLFHMPAQTDFSDKRQHLIRQRNRIYKCLMCEEVLKTKLELRAHMKTKHEKKPNLCLYCNKQFSSRQEYLGHVQTEEHRRNIPYSAFNHTCSHCDYSANSKSMLKAHVNRVHLNIRPFECEHCQKRYFDSTQLNHHIKTHTGQRKPKVCDICGANLAGPTALKKHRRLHTGENPYSCPYCDVRTNCTSSLKTHIMRKHMEPTITCPLCDLKFHTMNNARGHVKKVHWKSKEKFDFTKLKGLSPKDYDFFRDRRKALV